MNGTDTANKRTAKPYKPNTTKGPFFTRGVRTSGRAGASPGGGVADGSVHRSPSSFEPDEDPDWPSPEEIEAWERLRYAHAHPVRDGILTALLLLVMLVAVVLSPRFVERLMP